MTAGAARHKDIELKRLEALVQLAFARSSNASAGGGGLSKVLTAFTQPAVSSTVAVHVDSTAGVLIGGMVTVQGGGRYVAMAVTDATHVTLLNIGGPQNVAPLTVVPAMSPASLQAPSIPRALANLSPYSVRTELNPFDPAYGAVGDGVANDGPALQAFLNDIIAKNVPGRIPARNPAGNLSVFLTLQELQLNGSGTLTGEATSFASGSKIVAGSALMRSVLAVNTTFGDPGATDLPPTGVVTGLILDGGYVRGTPGSGVRRACLLLNSAYRTKFENVYCQNADVYGVNLTGRTYPLVLGAVTPGGGAPAGDMTAVAYDPNTGFGQNLQPNAPPFGFVVKFTTGGGLGVAQFVVSDNGGGTFTNQPQTVEASVNLILGMDLSLANSFPYASGIRLGFANVVYPLNGTYSFPVTVPSTNDNGSALNAGCTLTQVLTQHTGTLYTSAVLPYTGEPFGGYYAAGGNIVNVAGTATVAIGSQFITIAGGPDFVADDIREGDVIYVHDALFVHQGYFPIAGVLDSTAGVTTLIIVPGQQYVPGTVPTPTGLPVFAGAGLTYSIGHGGGIFEDNGTEENSNLYVLAAATLCGGAGFRIAGLHGATMENCGTSNIALPLVGAVCIGGSSEYTQNTNLIGVDLGEDGAVFSGGQSHGAEWIGPGRAPTTTGPGPISLQYQGNYTGGRGTLMMAPQAAVQLSPQVANVTSAAFTFPGPALYAIANHSWLIANAPSFFGPMTSAPTIAPPSPEGDGTRLTIICNPTSLPIVLADDDVGGSNLLLGAAYRTLGPYQQITFERLAGFWVVVADNAILVDAKNSGNRGRGDRIVITSDNVFHSVWNVETGTSGASCGTLMMGRIKAQSVSGTHVAYWTNCVMAYSSANPGNSSLNVLVGSPTGFGAPTFSTAGRAAAWRTQVTDDVLGFFSHIQVQGDNVAPVYWTLEFDQGSPAQSF